jgi:20S proteasome subunit beta 1
MKCNANQPLLLPESLSYSQYNSRTSYSTTADTQAVSDIVRYYLESHSIELGYARIPRVKSAAHLFRELCYTNKDRLMAGMIVGGYDSIDGGSIYSIPLGGSLIKQKFAVGGSGSTYIFGLIDSAWKDGMSRDEAEALVKKALSHAMARDGSSGGVIRMVTLDKDQEVQRVMIPGDKLDYLQ